MWHSKHSSPSPLNLRLYLKFVTTGWKLDLPQGTTTPSTPVYIHEPSKEGLYPFNYQRQYSVDQAANSNTAEWDPTLYGYGDYNDPTTTTVAAGYGAATVHNELILDKRFVLVGRGIYALEEWGYKPGTVAEMIEEILRKENRPMAKDEIAQEILKNKIVKRSTIYLVLSAHKDKFKKI